MHSLVLPEIKIYILAPDLKTRRSQHVKQFLFAFDTNMHYNSGMDNDERINTLEMNIAHLEQKLDDLSDVVAMQDQIITALRAKNNIIQSKIEDMEQLARDGEGKSLSAGEIAARDKPPHY